MHDAIRELALERERSLLAPLSPAERAQLLDMLHRMHEHLPQVEQATERFLAQHHPQARRRRSSPQP